MDAREHTCRQLWDAAQQGRAEEVRGILRASQLRGGIRLVSLEAALLVACCNNWPCVAQALLYGKTSPEAWSCAVGRATLHAAAFHGCVDVLHTLVLAKADLKQPCSWCGNPLHVASAYGQADAVRYLLSANACPRAVNCFGNTPAALATAYGHTAVLGVLGVLRPARADPAHI
jgi:hypothetical protein